MWIFKQILSTNSLRKCTEISLENLDVDTAAYRVIRSMQRKSDLQLVFRVSCSYHVLTLKSF